MSSPTVTGQAPALERRAAGALPDAVTRGIYVSSATGVLGYRGGNRDNRPPICTVKGAYPGGIAADSDGNLIDTDGGTHTIGVFKGPKMCGRKLGSIDDPYGQPSDVASLHAATGIIAVANIFDGSDAGSVTVCTLSSGCTKNLTISGMYEVAAVALAANGDCWASATNATGVATLTYFKGCALPGAVATGYRNAYYGGLDIDGKGHLLAISSFDSKLYVYKGCAPACTLFAGPFALHGEAFYGHLNKNSTRFATSDYQTASIDVYTYSPKSLEYLYSFNNGLDTSSLINGVTYNGRADQ